MANRFQKVERIPNPFQSELLSIVQEILSERKYRSIEETKKELAKRNFIANWKRVRWCGGVGSWRIMRNGRCRVQVSASVMGYQTIGRGREAVTGKTILHKKPAGFRYAWCVEF